MKYILYVYGPMIGLNKLRECLASAEVSDVVIPLFSRSSSSCAHHYIIKLLHRLKLKLQGLSEVTDTSKSAAPAESPTPASVIRLRPLQLSIIKPSPFPASSTPQIAPPQHNNYYHHYAYHIICTQIYTQPNLFAKPGASTTPAAVEPQIFTSPSLLQLALTSGLPADRIYPLEGENKGYTSYDQLISSARKNGIPHLSVRHASKDALAYLIYSSGKSGSPKAVMTSHGNITTATLSAMVNGMEMAKTQAPPVWNIPDGLHVTFTVLPLYHPLGLYTTSFFNFLNASTIVMLPKWDIDIFFDSVPKQSQAAPHTSRPGSLTRFPPVSQTYQELLKVTECLNSPSLACSMDAPKTSSSLPAVEARVIRPDESLAGPNEPGELLVHGGSVALGDKGNDKVTRETFVDGWVRTGDQIRIDEDEVLFSEDCTKTNCTIHKYNLFHIDTLKISGMQVSPVAIKNTILAQPDRLITDVNVARVSGGRTPDERILRAWIVLSPAGAALGKKEVVTRLNVWVQERLGRYKWLRGGIGIVETIPKSPNGKVLRRVLVEGYEKEDSIDQKTLATVCIPDLTIEVMFTFASLATGPKDISSVRLCRPKLTQVPNPIKQIRDF
ncbi:hypothetical protein F4604DRAFT_1685590 [Suillus subluteus]|nr:hypothetical protein F4604DRAFT_1685590 [Suillus subluteus]